MAAATVNHVKTIRGAGLDVVQEVKLSVLTSGQTEVVSHGGPSGVKPEKVEHSVIIAPTSGPVDLIWIEASDDLSSNTSSIKLSVPAAGDITNGVVLVRFYFPSAKSGGLVTA